MSPEEFAHEFGPEFTQPPTIDPHPYGMQPGYAFNTPPVKTGLTKRGKAALAIGVTVIAGGSLLTWQHYSAQAAANQVKAQEIQYQRDQLELERLKELNKANATNQKVQSTADAARQKQIDACVQDNRDLVGKQLGATYRSVLEDCQAQYQATTNTSDMQAAASSSDTGSGGGGGVSGGLLIGGGVLVAGLFVAAKKSTRSNQA